MLYVFFYIFLFRIFLIPCGLIIYLLSPDKHWGFYVSLFGLGVLDITEKEFIEYNQNQILDFYNNKSKGVVIFNHPSFIDLWAYGTVFNRRIVKPIVYKPNFPYPLSLFSDMFKPIYTHKIKSGQRKVIQEYLLSRKPREPLILISPSGGDTFADHRKLNEFKDSAFISRVPILPVVVRYSSGVERWPILKSLIKRLLGLPVYFKIRVLDPIYPMEDESIESVKKRTKALMESVPLLDDLHY